YDVRIPLRKKDRPKDFKAKLIKGYYNSEKDLVQNIKKHVVGGNKKLDGFKSVECQIMDIADDIAYSTYDLEDGLKAGFYHPISIFTYPKEVYTRIADKVSSTIGKTFTSQNVINVLFEIFNGIYQMKIPDNKFWSS